MGTGTPLPAAPSGPAAPHLSEADYITQQLAFLPLGKDDDRAQPLASGASDGVVPSVRKPMNQPHLAKASLPVVARASFILWLEPVLSRLSRARVVRTNKRRKG
jgi:hypothetical protein